MEEWDERNIPDVLDPAQLILIEAVHRGFLYQHLYTVGCLLLAQSAGVDTVTVELDEDIELETDKTRIYVQVKTRSKPIIPSDVLGALERGLALPPAWETLEDALSWCISQAERLNFSLLSPDSLVWKLAGMAQFAATGSPLNKQHAFQSNDLPALFDIGILRAVR